ncbi:MAG TPA: hypothetical protein VFC07_09140, partial [Verrucomicrobiae bacterium]|nr:hypothetical protein [Verrucomicrobiae bacterium]
MPEELDFEANYETTASHFRILRLATNLKSRLKTLRFEKIRYISPAAALVLASEVDRWNQVVGGKLRPNTEAWHEDIQRLLFEMGYFDLLHLPQPDQLSPTKNTTFLKFKRGDLHDPNAGQIAKQLRQEIENIVGGSIKRHFLFEGLSEAITNVSQHAYSSSKDIEVKQWWLSASYNRDQRSLCVIFYDQGVGIPETLPSSHLYEFIKDAFHRWP